MTEATRTPLQWLTELLAEIDSFDGSVYPPRSERYKDETHVGECPDELRKFYSFSQFCDREMEQLRIDAKYADSAEQEEMASRVGLLDMKQDVCDDIFQACLTDYFKDWNNRGHLHVRKGWEVVRCMNTRHGGPPSLPDLLRGLGFPIRPEE